MSLRSQRSAATPRGPLTLTLPTRLRGPLLSPAYRRQRRSPRLMSPHNKFVRRYAPDDGTGLGKEHRRCHRLGDDFVGKICSPNLRNQGAGWGWRLMSLSQTVESYPGFGTNCDRTATHRVKGESIQLRARHRAAAVTSGRVGLPGEELFAHLEKFNFAKQYSRHLVDVKRAIQHIVILPSSGRIKVVTGGVCDTDSQRSKSNRRTPEATA